MSDTSAADVIREAMDAKHDRPKLPNYIYADADKDGKLTYHIDYMKYSDVLVDELRVYSFRKSLFVYDKERGMYKRHTNQVDTALRSMMKIFNVSEKITIASREVTKHLNSMGDVDTYPFIGTFGTIHVLNGSVNLETGAITPASPDDLYDYRIETEYKEFPDGTPELDAFLDQYGSREPIDVLAKCIWQRAYHDTLKEITVFYGPKDSGKTTNAELVQSTLDGDIISRKNVSRTLLHELLQRFGYADLEGRLLNYGDDLPDMFIKNSGRVNTLVGSVNQHIERKGIDGYDAVVTAYYLFSANNLPPLDDDDSVLWGKIHLVEYGKVFTSARVPREKLFTRTLREQLLFRAVKLALEWRTVPYVNNQSPEEVRKKWHEASTDVDAFMLEATDPYSYGEDNSLDKIKIHYEEWCKLRGRKTHMKYLNKRVQPFLRRRSHGNVYELKLLPLDALRKEVVGKEQQPITT